MNAHYLPRYLLLLAIKRNNLQGFTIVDVIAHILLIGILIMAGPFFLAPSAQGFHNSVLIRASWLMRSRL